MEIYRYLPGTQQTLCGSTLRDIHCATTKAQQPLVSMLTTRVDVLKLCICSLGDSVIHTKAAICKIAAGVVQLPLHPVWGGVTAKLALTEAGSHLVHVAKSIIAAILVPLPALVSPHFAITSYRWLALPEAPKDGIFADLAHRVNHGIKDLLAHRHTPKVAIGLAIATAAAVGYRYYSAVVTPKWDFGSIGRPAFGTALVLFASWCGIRCCKPVDTSGKGAERSRFTLPGLTFPPIINSDAHAGPVRKNAPHDSAGLFPGSGSVFDGLPPPIFHLTSSRDMLTRDDQVSHGGESASAAQPFDADEIKTWNATLEKLEKKENLDPDELASLARLIPKSINYILTAQPVNSADIDKERYDLEEMLQKLSADQKGSLDQELSSTANFAIYRAQFAEPSAGELTQLGYVTGKLDEPVENEGDEGDEGEVIDSDSDSDTVEGNLTILSDGKGLPPANQPRLSQEPYRGGFGSNSGLSWESFKSFTEPKRLEQPDVVEDGGAEEEFASLSDQDANEGEVSTGEVNHLSNNNATES